MSQDAEDVPAYALRLSSQAQGDVKDGVFYHAHRTCR